jgi:hypothetical protein
MLLLPSLGGDVSVTASFIVAADTCMEELMRGGEEESWKPWTADPLAAAMARTQALVRRMMFYILCFGEEDALKEFRSAIWSSVGSGMFKR